MCVCVWSVFMLELCASYMCVELRTYYVMITCENMIVESLFTSVRILVEIMQPLTVCDIKCARHCIPN